MQVDLREDEGLEVQMAPLIDCVFLLLIFFLVATTLKKIDEELPLTLPDSAAAIQVQQPDTYLVLSIDRQGNFYMDGTPVSLNILQNGLRRTALESPQTKIRLDIDENTPFRLAMQVLDILRFEELTNVGINTRKDRFEPDK